MPNYIESITAQLAERLPSCNVDLLRLYALLVLTCGENCDEEAVHDAWSTWRTATQPEHRSLKPFTELTAEVQALDSKYAEAIRAVAAGLG